eukprot:SAG31_NODE_6661_length_1934_cov_1.786921_1_plen_141_part_10
MSAATNKNIKGWLQTRKSPRSSRREKLQAERAQTLKFTARLEERQRLRRNAQLEQEICDQLCTECGRLLDSIKHHVKDTCNAFVVREEPQTSEECRSSKSSETMVTVGTLQAELDLLQPELHFLPLVPSKPPVRRGRRAVA